MDMDVVLIKTFKTLAELYKTDGGEYILYVARCVTPRCKRVLREFYTVADPDTAAAALAKYSFSYFEEKDVSEVVEELKARRVITLANAYLDPPS